MSAAAAPDYFPTLTDEGDIYLRDLSGFRSRTPGHAAVLVDELGVVSPVPGNAAPAGGVTTEASMLTFGAYHIKTRLPKEA
jgi:hypothetical protein